ncbi:ATP-binding protein [Streptomyces sp. NPDC006365]|uniref:ATP-binding protein n=1 Tax=Streptomyces sp. NPDC006365 TaxID=3364744 RepID=UPI0036AA6F66
MNETDTEAGIELVAVAVAVGQARRFVTHTLRAWGLQEMTDTAALIVSELVTNAVRATGTSEPPGHALAESALVEVQLHVRNGSLLLEVRDRSSTQPAMPRVVDDGAEEGRGLILVEAMSAGWGVRRERAGGKVVYAELAVASSRETAATPVELSEKVQEVGHLAGEALLARLLETAKKRPMPG